MNRSFAGGFLCETACGGFAMPTRYGFCRVADIQSLKDKGRDEGPEELVSSFREFYGLGWPRQYRESPT